MNQMCSDPLAQTATKDCCQVQRRAKISSVQAYVCGVREKWQAGGPMAVSAEMSNAHGWCREGDQRNAGLRRPEASSIQWCARKLWRGDRCLRSQRSGWVPCPMCTVEPGVRLSALTAHWLPATTGIGRFQWGEWRWHGQGWRREYWWIPRRRRPLQIAL